MKLIVFLLVVVGCSAPRETPPPLRVSHRSARPSYDPTVYQIFVRSFADSNSDGIGDLRGISNKLDSYLNDGDATTTGDLSVGVLWLMPVFPTRSYHGYDVNNFRSINPEYGSAEDFRDLLLRAHERGVRVILDIPLNHTSDDHPWFRDALANPTSRFRSFYHFVPASSSPGGGWHAATDGTGADVRYQGAFSPHMPDLNFDNASVRQEMKDIVDFWLDLGVDGFRLDAAKHIYGHDLGDGSEGVILRNNDWWREFSRHVYSKNPEAILVGEVLGSRETLRRYSWGLDALLDEPFMEDLRHQVAHPGDGFLHRYRGFLTSARELNQTAHGPDAPASDVLFRSFPFAASHDKNPRLASELERQKDQGMTASVDQAYRLAMYLLLTVSERPILYMGDELMQRGWKWNGNPADAPHAPGDGSGIYDETLREPLPWRRSGAAPEQTTWFAPRFDSADDGVSVEEQSATGGILDLVRGLINLRAQHPDLANGAVGNILNDSADWKVFERGAGDASYLVLINATAGHLPYRFHDGWFPQYRGAQLIFWSDGALKTWDNTFGDSLRIEDSVDVAPYGLAILRK